MYSQEDLNAAVAAGALSEDDAARLRAHVEHQREMPRTDEENFRLVTSFNDVFVSIGVVILLVAVGSISGALFPDDSGSPALTLAQILVSGAAIGATAWGLAEVFTRRRRMALPSIILTLVFIVAMFFASMALVALPFGIAASGSSDPSTFAAAIGVGEVAGGIVVLLLALAGTALTVVAARLHWKRFMVPITVAVGVGAAVFGILLGIALAAKAIAGDDFDFPALPLVLLSGLAVFALAMRWDMSDRERTTRRSDVAFWLHLLAAPMIAHPLFALLGVVGGSGEPSIVAALGVIALYVAFGLVALAIDRRALLVSALAYVLIAMGMLLRTFGAVDMSFALTALVIGSALLTLSTFWTPIRRRVVDMLPGDWRRRVPPVSTIAPEAALAA